MKTLLLTGASGFLGAIIVKTLKLNFKINTVGRTKVNDIVCDLSDTVPDINQVYDLVVHAAGKAHSLPRNEKEAKEFEDINFTGIQNLCRALSLLPQLPKAFIFISTVAVYGLDAGSMITEDEPLLGNTPYARSKIMAEQWVHRWAEENNVILLVLRLPLIAGPNPPGNLGAMLKGIKSGRYLSIGKAEAKKSIIWAEDVARIIGETKDISGIFNLTDGYNPTFAELETAIAKSTGVKKVRKISYPLAKLLAIIGDLMGKRAPINTDKLKKITSELTFDDTKARKLLKWNPSSVLDKINEII